MSSIAPITGSAQSVATTSVQSAARPPAPTPPAAVKHDADHDGDSDSSNRVDVRA
jgi:hypothetical protein